MKFMDFSKDCESVLYDGLTDLNTGFDVPTIKYFSEEEFEIVLNRVDKLGLNMNGIEPFLDGYFYTVVAPSDFEYDNSGRKWYWQAFEYLRSLNKNLQYSASIFNPECE